MNELSDSGECKYPLVRYDPNFGKDMGGQTPPLDLITIARDGGAQGESGSHSSSGEEERPNVVLDEQGNALEPDASWAGFPKEESARFDALVDLVEYRDEIRFLVYRRNGEIWLSKAVKKTGEKVLLVPPQRKTIRWGLSRAEDVIAHFRSAMSDSAGGWEEGIFRRIVAYLKRACRLPTEEHYLLVSAWILHTYLMRRFHYTAILCCCGESDRGKSRSSRAILSLSRRGFWTSSLAEAQLIRISTRFGVTLGIDVYDFWKKVKSHKSEDAVLDRYERGKTILRVNASKRGTLGDLDAYDVFGPTIICTNTPVPPVYNSRCIEILNPLDNRKFAEVQELQSEAADIRAQLLAFRIKYFTSALPAAARLFARRFADVVNPLHQMILRASPRSERSFRSLLESIEKDRRFEKSETPEAEIIGAIWTSRDHVSKGKLAVKYITRSFNGGKDSGERLSEKSLGWRLRNIGFPRDRDSKGFAAIGWNEDQIVKLAEAYGVELKGGSRRSRKAA